MPSRSASRRIVKASAPDSSSSSRAATMISRARAVSGSAMRRGIVRLFSSLLESLVHPFEGGQGAPVQRLGEQRHEHATEVLLLDKANAAAVEWLDGEAVLAVEDPWHEQPAKPAQSPLRNCLAHRGPEHHGASALRLHVN